LPGVQIKDAVTAVILALVLALLNGFVKPILIILTIPITIISLGLFLLVINIFIIKWAAAIVPGFYVANWWAALLFSILLSFVNAMIESLINNQSKRNNE
jgi:putative membrane protein